MPMFLRTKQALSASLIVLTLVPTLAFARPVTEIVNASAPTVSRANFLSWAFEVLEIPKFKGTCTLPYARVPRGMKATLCAAQMQGALRMFGTAKVYPLQKPITRGEALLVITALTDKQSNEDVSGFRDVKTPEQVEAVRNAIAQKWMVPVSATTFGLGKPLTGSQAVSFLQALAGETPVQVPKVIISLGVPESAVEVPRADLMNAVWQLIKEYHLESETIDETEAAYRALEAMVDSLKDPYTSFFRPVQSSNFQTQLKGEISGIGAHIEDKDGVITVIAPLPNSPAERAGIKPGDEILEAGGKVLKDLGLDAAITFIRGPKGTTVELKIRRSGVEMMVTVLRDLIVIPEISVQWQGDIAIVGLVQFGEITEKNIRGIFDEIQKKNPRGIILDLRNNGGGLLSAADTVLSNFLPRGTVVAQVKSRTETTKEVTKDEPIVNSSTKIVVLVNKGSASASEIVAGALQDLKRGTIVGAVTFGKGTVQNFIDFGTGEGLKITIAEWLTPLGRRIDGVGVEPDVVIESEDRDEQLRKALDLLR